MSKVLLAPIVAVIFLALLGDLRAAEIESKVVEVQGDQVKLARDKFKDPLPGDKVSIYAQIPGVDDLALVASGKVTEVSGELITLKIDKATGKVAKGQLAKITSEHPVVRKDDDKGSQPTSSGEKPAVTYDDVLKLLKLKVSEDEILKALAASPTKFTLDKKQIDELKQAGASDKLLAAMQKPLPGNVGDISDIALLLDCSGSMVDKTPEGPTKMEAAKKSITEFVQKLSNGRRLTFIIFGHDKELKCEAVKVVRPLSALDDAGKEELIKSIEKLQPSGHTPLAKALEAAGTELAKAKGLCAIVVVSDGMETCKGDPAAVAAKLAKDLKLPNGVSVIGFDIKPEERKSITNIVDSGKGEYFPANSGAELAQRFSKVEQIIQPQTAEFPAEIQVSKNLRVSSWMTFRPLTHFQGDDKLTIWNARISGDGSKVMFASDKGTFLMSADPTKAENKPIKLGGAVNRQDTSDISADGSTVAWVDDTSIFVAKSDGTEKRKLPGGFNVRALRLTATGDKVFVTSEDGGALMMLTTDGENVKKLTTTADVSKVLGAEHGNASWRQNSTTPLAISDDGQHIAFTFGFSENNVYTVNGDGTGLRKLSPYEGKERWGQICSVAVSSDGKTVAYLVKKEKENKDNDTVRFFNWEGKEIGFQTVDTTNSVPPVFLSKNGSEAATCKTWAVEMFRADGTARRLPLELGISIGTRYSPIASSWGQTFSADLQRACIIIPDDKSVNQLVILDFTPRKLDGMPALRDLTIAPRFLLTDGTTNAEVTAVIDSPNLRAAGYTVLRDGVRTNVSPTWQDLVLELNTKADPPERGKVYFNKDFRLTKGCPAGPLTVRVFAYTKDGNVIAVDVDRVEGREP